MENGSVFRLTAPFANSKVKTSNFIEHLGSNHMVFLAEGLR